MNLFKLRVFIGMFLIAFIPNLTLFAQDNNKKTSIEKRAKDLVSQMTPEEKLGIIVGDGRFLPAIDPNTVEDGKGMIITDQRSKLLIPRLSVKWHRALKTENVRRTEDDVLGFLIP